MAIPARMDAHACCLSNLKKVASGSIKIKAIPRKIFISIKQYKCTKKIRSSNMYEATRFFTWIIEEPQNRNN